MGVDVQSSLPKMSKRQSSELELDTDENEEDLGLLRGGARKIRLDDEGNRQASAASASPQASGM